MVEPDQIAQLREIQAGMRAKAERLLELHRKADRNGRIAEPEPVQVPESLAPRVPEVPSNPGPSDGGARQPVPPKTHGELLRDARAAGDVNAAMHLNSQKLAGLIQRQSEGN
ncbi:MAG: hypothetical protein HY827_10280 [Actinobacteria bacterium]|nr:hypothetical protein [Actinomycetota bacterium]